MHWRALRNLLLCVFHIRYSKVHNIACLNLSDFDDNERWAYFAAGDQESLSNAKCELMNTCFVSTTDYLADEGSKTPRTKDKEPTSNTQTTSDADVTMTTADTMKSTQAFHTFYCFKMQEAPSVKSLTFNRPVVWILMRSGSWISSTYYVYVKVIMFSLFKLTTLAVHTIC